MPHLHLKTDNNIGNTLNDRQTAIDKQIEQWTLIGPLLMLGALLVLLLTPERPLFLTSIAFIALPICWRWRIPAAAIATALLSSVLIYQYSLSAGNLTFWHLAFAGIASLTLWITAFCSQEVEHLFSTFQEETSPPTSKTQNFKKELSLLAQKKGEELRAAESKIANLQLQLSSHEKLIQSHSEAASIFQSDLDEYQSQNSELQKKLVETTQEAASHKQNCSELTESLNKANVELEALTNKCAKTHELEGKLAALEEIKAQEDNIKQSSLSAFEQKLAETEELLFSKDLLIQEHEKSLIKFEEQNASLLQEIFQRRHECTLLKQHCEEMEESLEAKENDAGSASEEITLQFIADIEKLHADAADKDAALKSHLQQLAKLENDFNLNQQELIESRQKIEELSKRLTIDNAKLNADAIDKDTAIQSHKEYISKLEADLNLNQQELSECRQKAEELVAICEQKESLLVEQLEKAQDTNTKPDRQLRKLEGLYKQLKEQFADKSNLLDSTRQELFAAHEELTRFQKDFAEKELDGKQLDYLTSIEKQLQTTHEELILAEKRHIDEIDALQALIKNLSPQETEEKNVVKPVQKAKSAKGRTPKQTKTTNWANKILSRCNEVE